MRVSQGARLGHAALSTQVDGFLGDGVSQEASRWVGARGACASAHLNAIHGRLSAIHPYVSALATCLAGLLLLLCFDQRRRAQDHLESEEEEEELQQEPESSEEKRLAFACLSSAIEDVKDAITEQQYLSLYSASAWCFNLTPYWAGSVPRPPSPNGNAASDSAPLGEQAHSEGTNGELARRAVVRY